MWSFMQRLATSVFSSILSFNRFLLELKPRSTSLWLWNNSRTHFITIERDSYFWTFRLLKKKLSSLCEELSNFLNIDIFSSLLINSSNSFKLLSPSSQAIIFRWDNCCTNCVNLNNTSSFPKIDSCDGSKQAAWRRKEEPTSNLDLILTIMPTTKLLV